MNSTFSSQQIDTIIKYKRYLKCSRAFQKRALTVLFSSLTLTAFSWILFIVFLLVPALKTSVHLQLYTIYIALFLTALSVVVLIGGPIVSICIDSCLDKYRNNLPSSVKDSYSESENKIETQQNLEDDDFLTTTEVTIYSLSENELESELDQRSQKIHSICVDLLKYDDIILKSIRNPSFFQSILSEYVKFNNLCEKSYSRYPVPFVITALVVFLLATASNGLRKEFVKYSYEIHEFSVYFVDIFSFCLCVFLVYCPSLESKRKHTMYVVRCFKQLANCFKELRKY